MKGPVMLVVLDGFGLGDGGAAETWSDLGITIPGLDDDKIVRVSRQNNSGTYVYFREAVLGKGDRLAESRAGIVPFVVVVQSHSKPRPQQDAGAS